MECSTRNAYGTEGNAREEGRPLDTGKAVFFFSFVPCFTGQQLRSKTRSSSCASLVPDCSKNNPTLSPHFHPRSLLSFSPTATLSLVRVRPWIQIQEATHSILDNNHNHNNTLA